MSGIRGSKRSGCGGLAQVADRTIWEAMGEWIMGVLPAPINSRNEATMAIAVTKDEKGHSIEFMETRWKRGLLTLTRIIARKRTTDFQFFGSLKLEEVITLRDELTKWLELQRQSWRIKDNQSDLYLQSDAKTWGPIATAHVWLTPEVQGVLMHLPIACCAEQAEPTPATNE